MRKIAAICKSKRRRKTREEEKGHDQKERPSIKLQKSESCRGGCHECIPASKGDAVTDSTCPITQHKSLNSKVVKAGNVMLEGYDPLYSKDSGHRDPRVSPSGVSLPRAKVVRDVPRFLHDARLGGPSRVPLMPRCADSSYSQAATDGTTGDNDTKQESLWFQNFGATIDFSVPSDTQGDEDSVEECERSQPPKRPLLKRILPFRRKKAKQ